MKDQKDCLYGDRFDSCEQNIASHPQTCRLSEIPYYCCKSCLIHYKEKGTFPKILIGFFSYLFPTMC